MEKYVDFEESSKLEKFYMKCKIKTFLLSQLIVH